MPPVGNVTCQPNNATTEDSSNIGKDDLNALLYIVVTLLFYSMGIIIGIITYLKREQAEMEEDKMFDMYMQLKREPFNLYKRERVQQMALYLKQLEEQQAAREKIENWKTVEQNQLQAHIQRYQACRRHVHRHASCPDCSKTSPIPEICHSFGDGATLAIAEGGWPESGGGTAFLCSLTLGVCEPLLTPDSKKRVTLPDLRNMEGNSATISTLFPSILRPYPNVSEKSAFRQQSLTIHYSKNGITFPKEVQFDQNACSHVKQTHKKTTPHETSLDSPSMFERGDIELKELRQFNYEEVKAVFQKNSAAEGESHNVCDNVSFNSQNVPPLFKRSGSLTKTPGKCRALIRQLSHDPGDRISDLTVHAPLTKSYNKIADKNNENIPTSVDKQAENYYLVMSPRAGTRASSKEELEENILSSEVTNVENMHQSELDLQEQQQQEEHQLYHELEQDHLQQVRQEIPLLTSPVIIPSTAAKYSPQKFELPLHLFVVTQQQQQSQSGDVRPKVFIPIPNIPQTVKKDEVVTMCTSSPSSSSPQTTQRIQNPLCDAGRKDNSQSVDITDVTRARKLGLNWKSKTVDKKTAPRSQPERRGALFFTQRSLQKDLDSPKAVSGRKHSRPSFTWQESIDSHHSRTSDMSENIDSPLLHPNSDIESGLILSSPSSSVGSNSLSPSATNKQA